jgi:YidC/Oxa1 family membrane protein insertase
MGILQKAITFLLEVFHALTGSYGISLCLLSVCVSVVLLPFYALAGVLEAGEKRIQQRLSPFLTAIGALPDSSVRHARTAELYAAFGYSTLYSLRSLASLVVQIPVLIAAYRAIAAYEPLQGVSFAFISDLSENDTLIFGFNVLPFAMTAFNIAAVFVSMLSAPEHDDGGNKALKQGVFIAVAFFVLLYTAPSGLLLYWTLNNLWSLCRYVIAAWRKNPGFLRGALKKTGIKQIIDAGYAGAFLSCLCVYFIISFSSTEPFVYARKLVLFSILCAGLLGLCNLYLLWRSYGDKPMTVRAFAAKIWMFAAPVLLLFFGGFAVCIAEKLRSQGILLLLAAALISSLSGLIFGRRIRSPLKAYLPAVLLSVSAMLFPAILYYKSNIVYFNGTDTIVYIAALAAFALCSPFVVSALNPFLSTERLPWFSTAFVLALMFLPLARDGIYIPAEGGLIFVVLYSLFVFFISFAATRRLWPAAAVFFVCASVYITAFVHTEDIDLHPQITTRMPNDLAMLEMKDKPNIYLFMHDSFPHKDMAHYLNLESYDALIDTFKENNFKVYDVYPLTDHTLATMSTTFEMDINAIRPGYYNGMRKYVSGYNTTNELLHDNGYVTGAANLWSTWLFFSKTLYDYDISGEGIVTYAREKNAVLCSILEGHLNTMLATDGDGIWGGGTQLVNFIESKSNQTPLFAWTLSGPGHTTYGVLGSVEAEWERWKPLYDTAVEKIEQEIYAVTKADPGAIIIFMSDHGMNLLDKSGGAIYSFTPDESITYIHIRDHFGAFMAVRWPDPERAAKYDSDFNVTQDLFPIVFAYLFDSDVPLKYKPKDTAVRWKNRKFDKGILYPYQYKDDYDNELSGAASPKEASK